jgi:hypothetical protein
MIRDTKQKIRLVLVSNLLRPFLNPPCRENAGPLLTPVRVVCGKKAFGPGVDSANEREEGCSRSIYLINVVVDVDFYVIEPIFLFQRSTLVPALCFLH